MTENSISSDLLVVGGGIAGITAAVEAAETGLSVTLIEKSPYIGGKVAQFSQYFPKLCPPSCGLEINIRRLRTNPSIKLLTVAEVSNVVKINALSIRIPKDIPIPKGIPRASVLKPSAWPKTILALFSYSCWNI